MVSVVLTKFKKDVYNLKDYLILITTTAKDYTNTNIEIIDYFINDEKIPGVYVTLNKPNEIIKRTLTNKGVDPRLIIFIDGATQNKTNERTENCLFISSLEKLSDISVAIDQAVKALPQEKFLFFDSVNTLSIFNNPKTVARFVHFLAGKMRELKVKGIIISLNKDSDQELISELTQLSDSRIDIGGN